MPDDTTPSPGIAGRRGLRIDASSPAELRAAVDAAFDYRGDVTILRRSEEEPISGYLFNRTNAADISEAFVQVMREDGGTVRVSCADILAIEFTGRDTAEGKSFETWVKKYVRKKLAGETASIEADPHDTD